MINLLFTDWMIWCKFFNFSKFVPVLENEDNNSNNDFVVLFWGKVIYVKCLTHSWCTKNCCPPNSSLHLQCFSLFCVYIWISHILLDYARIILRLHFACPWTRLEVPGILEALLIFLAYNIILKQMPL